jgi:DHA1 family bicyclomycin/chloramphenicol resistance-like MFS transporter
MQNNHLTFWFPLSMISLLVIGYMSNDLFLPSMLELTHTFNVSANVIQNTISLWFFGCMLFQPIIGPISDFFGRKIVLIAAAFLLCIASLYCALAPNISSFYLGRFLQGVAVSGIMVAAFAAIHEAYEKAGKATAMLGYVGMATATAPVAGPILGGYIAAYIHWEANFYLVSIVSIFLIILLSIFMPSMTVNKQALQWRFLLGNYKNLLANRSFVTTIVCYGLLFFAGGAFLAAAAFIYGDILGLTVQHIGFGMMPMFICYMLAASFAGQLEKKYPAKKIISTTFMGVCVLMILFVLYSLTVDIKANIWLSFVVILGSFALYYSALGLIGPPLNHISLSQASGENKGIASGLLTSTMMLGSTLGSFLISLVYNGELYSITLCVAGSVFAAAILFWVYSNLVETDYEKIPT